MSVNGDAAKHDELVAEVFASRVALYDSQDVAENIGRIVCLELFTGMRPRNARVKLAGLCFKKCVLFAAVLPGEPA